MRARLGQSMRTRTGFTLTTTSALIAAAARRYVLPGISALTDRTAREPPRGDKRRLNTISIKNKSTGSLAKLSRWFLILRCTFYRCCRSPSEQWMTANRNAVLPSQIITDFHCSMVPSYRMQKSESAIGKAFFPIQRRLCGRIIDFRWPQR